MRKESTWLWRAKMKIGMCEEVDVTGFAGILEMQNREPNDHMIEPDILNILENHEDVNSLKAQVKERLILKEESLTTMAPSLLENRQSKNTNFDMAVNSDMTVNLDNDVTEGIVLSQDLNGSVNKICNGSGSLDNSTDEPSLDVKKPGCDEPNMTGDQSLKCYYSTGYPVSDTAICRGVDQHHKTQHKTSDHGTCLTSDLHVHETHGVPVNLSNSDNSRLSQVLENVPLVYIPMTKQLGLMGETSELNKKDLHLDQNSSESLITCDNNVDNSGLDEDKTFRYCESYGISDDQFDCNNTKGDSASDVVQRLTPTGAECKFGNGKSDKIDSTSFSSVSSISTGTEVSLSAASAPDESSDCKNALADEEDSDFMEINLHSRNSYEPTRSQLEEDQLDDQGARPKKKSLSGFLSRNLFSRKPKEVNHSHESAPGWKLFGRIPPKETEKKDVSQVLEEYQAKQRTNSSESLGRKKQDIEVLSTTALILENRPMNLPSKCPEEEQRHKLEYEAMVEAAKKKELKELRLKKKHLQQQLKLEDQRVARAKYWTNEVLPNWENMHTTKKTRELWWRGLPPSVRGKVWKLAIGNDLNITSELYEICLSRAKDKMNLFDIEPGDPNGPSDTSSEPPSNRETSVELIKLDVARTFPQLCIFQKGGPYYELLHSLLGAYACYRPDVGYVQGMSFIAAVLLLNMDVADAFICFTNLLNKPCQVAFFRMDENLMKCYFQTFTEFFKENMPKLHQHFIQLSLTPEVYIIDWMFTLFSKSLPLDVACRVWDVFCRDGEEFLFRTALGLLKMYEDILLQMDFIHLAQFMTKLPEVISGERLFKSIDWIKMNIDKKRFIQVLLTFRESMDS